MRRAAGSMLMYVGVLGSPWIPTFAQAVVPITAEPDHHLAFSNDYVRVFKVDVPPKSETLYHQHDYDYFYVAIGDADVTSTRLDEEPVSLKLKNSDVKLARGPFAHKAANNGDKPFQNVTVELLRGAGEQICEGTEIRCASSPLSGDILPGPFWYPNVIYWSTTVEATRVILAPKSASTFPRSACLVLVPLTDGRVQINAATKSQWEAMRGEPRLIAGTKETRVVNRAGHDMSLVAIRVFNEHHFSGF